MAVQGPIPVDFGYAFPRGAFAAGGFEPVRDFEASKGGQFVQSRDKATGLPMWQADIIDADPEAREKSVRVKIAAAEQPTVPPPSGPFPFTAVELAGVTVTSYVNQSTGRLAFSLRASGVRAVRPAGRGSGGQEAAA